MKVMHVSRPGWSGRRLEVIRLVLTGLIEAVVLLFVVGVIVALVLEAGAVTGALR